MSGTTRRTARRTLLLIGALLAAACGSDASLEVPDASAPTVTPPPAVDTRGDALDLYALPSLAELGFAVEADGAVVLMTKSGRPIGHIPGVTLDDELGARIARPAITTADGRRFAVTLNGVVDLNVDFRLPLGGPELVGDYDGAKLKVHIAKAGAAVADLGTVGGFDDLRISATGGVVTRASVGLDNPTAFDTATGGSVAVPFGCWVSDRHEDDTYFVCKPEGVGTTIGIRRGDGEVSRLFDPVADGTWTSVQIGPDGETVMLNALVGCGTPKAYFASIQTKELRPVAGEAAAIGLFFKQSGEAWVALPGDSCDATDAEPGIYLYAKDGSRVLQGSMLALRSGQMWIG